MVLVDASDETEEIGVLLLVQRGHSLVGADGAGDTVDQVHQGADDHHCPHTEAGLDGIIAMVHVLVGLDGEGASSAVHDGCRQAEQGLQKAGGGVKEDISNEERDSDEKRGPNGDYACQLTVPSCVPRAENTRLGEVQAVLTEQSDRDQSQDNFHDLQYSGKRAQGAEVDGETHFGLCFMYNLTLKKGSWTDR